MSPPSYKPIIPITTRKLVSSFTQRLLRSLKGKEATPQRKVHRIEDQIPGLTPRKVAPEDRFDLLRAAQAVYALECSLSVTEFAARVAKLVASITETDANVFRCSSGNADVDCDAGNEAFYPWTSKVFTHCALFDINSLSIALTLERPSPSARCHRLDDTKKLGKIGWNSGRSSTVGLKTDVRGGHKLVSHVDVTQPLRALAIQERHARSSVFTEAGSSMGEPTGEKASAVHNTSSYESRALVLISDIVTHHGQVLLFTQSSTDVVTAPQDCFTYHATSAALLKSSRASTTDWSTVNNTEADVEHLTRQISLGEPFVQAFHSSSTKTKRPLQYFAPLRVHSGTAENDLSSPHTSLEMAKHITWASFVVDSRIPGLWPRLEENGSSGSEEKLIRYPYTI